MESVVYDDTPLASYLEGSGEATATAAAAADGHDDDSGFVAHAGNAESPVMGKANSVSASFAPGRSSTAHALYRNRIPTALRLRARSTSNSLSRIHTTCSAVVRGHLGPRENATFLEKFRYTIITSDLLSGNQYAHNRSDSSKQANKLSPGEIGQPVFSTLGVLSVAGAAFVLAGSIAWARNVANGSSLRQLLLTISYVIVGLATSFAFTRRNWLQHIRAQAIDDATAFVANAHAFDAALSTAVTIVQEVELVARGYRISTPLPPVSRLDDQGQQRRCARLRSASRRATQDLLQPLAAAAMSLDSSAIRADLERYHDIYEITRSDIDEVEQLAVRDISSDEDGESLKALKVSMHQLLLARKLFLCDLLALDANGTKTDYFKWHLASQALQSLSSKYLAAALALDSLLSDEERFASPRTSKIPLTPNRERARMQIRKLGGLSSGIRGLQAKMHLLREEADQGVEGSEDSGELSQSLLLQFEAIGADLKALLQEWEEGRAALTSSHKKRQSMSSAGLLSPRAETPTSLSGSTAIGGSPADAFRVLNGEIASPQLDAASSDEEIFEAVALPPRQRSTLSREERIARMASEREQREKARESRQANNNMLRELETVLKHKPQGSKSSRRVTVM